jgi:hypothetical protein
MPLYKEKPSHARVIWLHLHFWLNTFLQSFSPWHANPIEFLDHTPGHNNPNNPDNVYYSYITCSLYILGGQVKRLQLPTTLSGKLFLIVKSLCLFIWTFLLAIAYSIESLTASLDRFNKQYFTSAAHATFRNTLGSALIGLMLAWFCGAVFLWGYPIVSASPLPQLFLSALHNYEVWMVSLSSAVALILFLPSALFGICKLLCMSIDAIVTTLCYYTYYTCLNYSFVTDVKDDDVYFYFRNPSLVTLVLGPTLLAAIYFMIAGEITLQSAIVLVAIVPISCFWVIYDAFSRFAVPRFIRWTNRVSDTIRSYVSAPSASSELEPKTHPENKPLQAIHNTPASTHCDSSKPPARTRHRPQPLGGGATTHFK